MTEPALTAEEWREGPAFVARDRTEAVVEGDAECVRIEFVSDGRHALEFFDAKDRHAVAALALHGQPYGFAWTDVDALEALMRMGCACGVITGEDHRQWEAALDVLPTLVERLSAILPPREHP